MYLKTGLKKIIGRLFSTDLLEKLTEYSILGRHLPLEKVPVKPSGREQLWRDAVLQIDASAILYLEFGVWKGYSIEYFLSLIDSPDSKFYGFDSFEGLPENWRGMDSGHFSTGGNIPDLKDPRAVFVKGWFSATLPPLLDQLSRESDGHSVLIHFDADLYSSTLFLLYTITQKISDFYFIFDEFSGHESRALYNFMQASGAKVDFYSQTTWQDCPSAVFGRLTIRS
jgi:hypothetical protein